MRRFARSRSRSTRFRSRSARSLARISVVATLALAFPASALAQVCLGVPAGAGEFALGGTVSFSDGGTGYMLGGNGNVEGPLAFGAGIGFVDLDNVDSNLLSVAGQMSVDLPVEGFAACPLLGLGYSTWSDTVLGIDVDVSQVSLPLGMGVGTRIGIEGGTELIPSAQAGLLFARGSVSASAAGETYSETESDTAFFVGGGATLVFGHFFGRAGVMVDTFDESDSVISVGVGVRF
jgi:hypothetical protein